MNIYDFLSFLFFVMIVIVLPIAIINHLDTTEFQSRIDQCKSNQSLLYPEDTRAWYNPSGYLAFGGINLMSSCTTYRNATTSYGILWVNND